MANPSGRTFHYSQEKLNEPGYPGIVYADGSRAAPALSRNSGAGSVGGMMSRYPLPVFFGALAVGYLAGCLLSRS